MRRIWRSIRGALGGGGTSPSKPDQDSFEGESNGRSGPQFAFVCLKNDLRPDEETMKAALAKWHEVPIGAVTATEPEPGETGGRVDAYEIEGRTVMIGAMGMPIPAPDIEYACANSFMWPEAAEALRGHTSHLIVMAMGGTGELSPAEQGIFLSRSIAACTEAYEAVAVYWGHANTVHNPELFRELMEDAGPDMHSIPAPLWIGFLRARNEKGGVDVYTSGLSAFGAMECEVIGSHQPPSEIVSLLTGLGAYLIDRGNVIGDGDTVGGDENHRIRARHADSAIGREGKVLQIEM